MPELKHTFQGGKMEKDLDERILPNGQYREALNIEVATSEDSDVGAAQNIIGNVKRTSAVSGPDNKYEAYNKHIASVVDPENDTVYRFLNTEDDGHGIWMDRIVEYNMSTTDTIKEKAVVVDIYKVKTALTGVYRGPCDIDLFLDFTNNTYQIRWGMQLIIPGSIEKEDNIYIKHIERLTSNSIRARINVNELTALNGAGFDFISQIGNTEIYLEGDRNLNFHPERKITGINVIDGMIFWTDNYSEPKKIHIERSKQGSTAQAWDTWRDPSKVDVFGFDIGDFDQHTRLVVNNINPVDTIKNNDGCGSVVIGPATPTNTSGGGVCGCTIERYWIGFAHVEPAYANHFVHQTPIVPTNFDSQATIDDGSCDCTFDIGDGHSGTVDCYTSNAVYNAFQAQGTPGAIAQMDLLDPGYTHSFQQNIPNGTAPPEYNTGQYSNYNATHTDGWLVDVTPKLPVTIDANCGQSGGGSTPIENQ